METIFNFSNDNTEYIYALEPKIILHIKPIKPTCSFKHKSILYFTDEVNNRINIPHNFIINPNKKRRIIPNEKNEYTLVWGRNYHFINNEKTLCNIENIKPLSVYNSATEYKWIITPFYISTR